MTDSPVKVGVPAPLLVDEREAARLLGVCARTVFSLAAVGKLHPVKVGAAKRYALADLRRFIADAQQQARQDGGAA